MEREDMRVLELGGGLDLAQEALGAQACRQVWSQDLDRNLPVVLQVFGDVYGRHPPRADVTFDAVSVRQRGIQASKWVGHSGSSWPTKSYGGASRRPLRCRHH